MSKHQQKPPSANADLSKKAQALLSTAQKSGVPTKVAAAMISMLTGEQVKTAEDAINPAVIVGGSAPDLQTAAGVPSQLSQGYEAGEGTPRECAPNTGEGAGRELLSSNESVINATKAQAKGQNKSALNEVLTEPAMSAAHDHVLSESLDNTSSAGVKISAARELLRKFAGQSRENAFLLSELVKAAQEAGSGVAGEEGSLSPEDLAAAAQGASGAQPMPPGAMPPGAMPPGAIPPEGLGGMGGMEGAEGMEGEESGMPSDEALEAASAGVTPEELLAAHTLLASQAGEAGQAEAAEAAIPPEGSALPAEGGGEEQVGVKSGQFGQPGGSQEANQGAAPNL